MREKLSLIIQNKIKKSYYKNLELHPETVLEVAVSDEGTAGVVDSAAQTQQDVAQGHHKTFLTKEFFIRKAFILIHIFFTISKVT